MVSKYDYEKDNYGVLSTYPMSYMYIHCTCIADSKAVLCQSINIDHGKPTHVRINHILAYDNTKTFESSEVYTD